MSVATREWVAHNDNLFFGSGAGVTKQQMQNDLLSIPSSPDALDQGAQTTVIALLEWLLKEGHYVELTCVQTGHDWSPAHTPGYGFDCWPLASATQDDWLDASAQRFKQFLYDVSRSPYAFQIGLIGDGSDSPDNFHYAEKGFKERGAFIGGVSVFQDSGGAHIHIRAVPA